MPLTKLRANFWEAKKAKGGMIRCAIIKRWLVNIYKDSRLCTYLICVWLYFQIHNILILYVQAYTPTAAAAAAADCWQQLRVLFAKLLTCNIINKQNNRHKVHVYSFLRLMCVCKWESNSIYVHTTKHTFRWLLCLPITFMSSYNF